MTLPVCSTISRDYETPAETITLDEGQRNRRRMLMRGDNGLAFMLDLPETRLLRHGDGLLLDDGRVVAVIAAPEPLMAVSSRDGRHLAALAWQIGNRHLAAQIEAGRILIRRDPVIRAMLEGLGADVADVAETFDPEGGAYGGHHHGDGHGHR